MQEKEHGNVLANNVMNLRYIEEKCVGQKVSIFLMNGVCLKGTLTGIDGSCIIMMGPNGVQIILIHAVSTISPISEEQKDF